MQILQLLQITNVFWSCPFLRYIFPWDCLYRLIKFNLFLIILFLNTKYPNYWIFYPKRELKEIDNQKCMKSKLRKYCMNHNIECEMKSLRNNLEFSKSYTWVLVRIFNIIWNVYSKEKSIVLLLFHLNKL